MDSEVLLHGVVVTTAITIVIWMTTLLARPAPFRHALWRIALTAFWLAPAIVLVSGWLQVSPLTLQVSVPPLLQQSPGVELPTPQDNGSDRVSAIPSVAPAPRVRPGGLLLLLWAAGAVVGGALLLRDLHAVRRLLYQSSVTGDPVLLERVAGWAAEIGLQKAPALAASGTVTVPTVVGWRAPVVLLPSGFSAGDPSCDAVIVHELAHIRRGDVAVQWVARLTRALCWWHPFVWLIGRKLRASAEEACDDWAVGLTGHAKDYAGMLVQWAEVAVSARNLACAYQGKALIRRVKRILTERKVPTMQLSTRTKVLLAVCAVCVIVAAGLVRVQVVRAQGQEAPEASQAARLPIAGGFAAPIGERQHEADRQRAAVDHERFERTPLHVAAYDGQTAQAEALLAGGAQVNATDKRGQTPLHLAAAKAREEVTELLLEQGADVNAKNDDGVTPLHWAAQNGHVEVVELLLDRGAEIDAKDSVFGMTPLHWAAFYGEVAAAEVLLQRGAAVNARDNRGETPLEAARAGLEIWANLPLEAAHAEVEQLFLDHGGAE